MVEIGQKMRKRITGEPRFWDDSVDRKNTERMKKIASEIGWSTLWRIYL